MAPDERERRSSGSSSSPEDVIAGAMVDTAAAAVFWLVGAAVEGMVEFAAGAGDRRRARAKAKLSEASHSGSTLQLDLHASDFVRRYPHLPEGYAARAEARLRQRRLGDALEAVRKAEQLGLYKMHAHLLRAAIHRDAGRIPQAIKEFTALVASDVPAVRQYGLVGRAGLLVKTGDLSQARRDADAAIAESPDAAAYQVSTSVHLERRDYPAALRDLSRAVALCRDRTERRRLLIGRAALHQLLGRTEKAREDRAAAAAIALPRSPPSPPPSPPPEKPRRRGRRRIYGIVAGMSLASLLILGFCFRADLFPPPSLPVGKHPAAVAISHDGRWVYVVNEGSGTVSVIATANHAVAATVPVGPGPRRAAVTPDGRRLYVLRSGRPNVVFMDTATRRVHNTSVSGFDDGLAISLDGRRVYLIDWGLGTGSGRMAVLDTTKNSLIKTISLTTNPESVTVAPGGRLVYVTHFFKDMVSVVDTATLSVVRTIDIGAAVSGAAVSPNGRLLYLGGVDAVAVVETDQNAVTDRIEGDRMLTDVVISADGSRLYALGDDSTRLTVIATTDRMVIASVRLGKNPDAMGITPDGRHLYVADFATGSVSIVDTATNSVIDPGRTGHDG